MNVNHEMVFLRLPQTVPQFLMTYLCDICYTLADCIKSHHPFIMHYPTTLSVTRIITMIIKAVYKS